LNTVRPIHGDFGMALALAPQATERAVATLDVTFMPQEMEASRTADPGLEALRTGVPAARSLQLLAALARGFRDTVILEYVAGTHLRVAVTPCA
jgi:hypothetical protein